MAIFFTIIFFLFLVISIIGLYWIKIDMYFLQFKLEKHPILIAMLDDIFQRICKEEGIRVFQKTYEELNINRPNEDDKVLGTYVYILDVEHQQKMTKCLCEIEELEIKWKMSYKKLCQFVGHDTTIDKEDFALPRILLCEKESKKYGLLSYYSTRFHELAHHFAIKEIGVHSEDDANRIAHRLIIQNFPYFFQLIPFINFRYRLNMKELTPREKLRACIEYLKYVRIKNKKREAIL